MHWYEAVIYGVYGAVLYNFGRWKKTRELRQNYWVWACPEKDCGYSVKSPEKYSVLQVAGHHQGSKHPRSLRTTIPEITQIKE